MLSLLGFGGASEQRETVAGDADQRRGERAVQGQLVERVGKRPQVGEQVADLLVFPEAPDRRERVQAAILQRALVDLQIADGAQQHRHPARARGAALHQLRHARGQQPRFRLAPERRRGQFAGDLARELLVLIPTAPVRQQQLHERLPRLNTGIGTDPACRLPFDATGLQCRVVTADEALLEHRVHHVEQRLAPRSLRVSERLPPCSASSSRRARNRATSAWRKP